MAVSGLVGKDATWRRKGVFSHPLERQLPQKTPVQGISASWLCPCYPPVGAWPDGVMRCVDTPCLPSLFWEEI